MEAVDAGAAPNAPGVDAGAGAPNMEPPEAAAGLLCWPPNIEEVVAAAAGAAAGARPPNAGALAGVIVVWPVIL